MVARGRRRRVGRWQGGGRHGGARWRGGEEGEEGLEVEGWAVVARAAREVVAKEALFVEAGGGAREEGAGAKEGAGKEVL